MNATLQDKITEIVAAASEEIVRLVRESSMSEVFSYPNSAPVARVAPPAAKPFRQAKPDTAPSKPRPGPTGRVRRSPDQLNKDMNAIVALVAKHPTGLRSEQIKQKLGLATKDVPRPIAAALEQKLLKKKGEKRSTTYYAAK